MNNQKLLTGFTLIEMIVVVGIIGLLSAISTIGFSRQRTLARDARRQTDIGTITTALETMFEDKRSYSLDGVESTFIDTSVGISSSASIPNPPQSDWAPNSELRDLVTGRYLDSLPKDPLNNADYQYLFELDDQLRGYYLRARLEATAANSTYVLYNFDIGKKLYVKASNDYIQNSID